MKVPSIEAVNLIKRYGNFVALDGLSVKLEGAKCVGFLGPNGAGKTTTLKLFTDMIRPSGGSALINGITVYTDKRRALSHCGTLIETPEIYPSLTPYEALSMVAELRGIPSRERKHLIDNALSEVKMEEWKDKKVGRFSKGMKQRVNIASAILSEPDILMLDEPTTGLDPRGTAEVREIIKNLKKKQRLIFMSSHLLPEVNDVCDEVAMIDHGKLLVYDTLENVKSRFRGNGESVAVATFLLPIDDDIISDKIAKHPAVVKVSKSEQPDELIITLKEGNGHMEDLLYYIAMLKVGLMEFRQSSLTLEDTYLKLIKDSR